ncbi:GIY-YIG nuclease family protein [Chryseobacterium oryctis]|uniref:GIY-YIG domain-containing protein n=1 Tax=Chryseobacterium oryctis TaxID=2952618 RepID=A0ABT3HK74_9FLAO|nr:hypothetical protein [Chryseobacterium oryctis]MCW3160172.1 hypothetical protein [Chryseobacterium oryctis]
MKNKIEKKFISFNEIENISVKELIKKILKNHKLIIGELKLVDLIFENQSMTGIYVIFDEKDNPVYVGKTGSRAILERFAAHFDLRPGAFMNSFLCALAGKRKQRIGPHATEEDLQNVYQNALTHKLVFIQIPNNDEHKSKISKLEGIISKILETKYNSRRGKAIPNTSQIIRDIS